MSITQAIGITATAGSGSGGVASLNALTGAISLTSTGGTVTITPSGSTINLEAAGGGLSAIAPYSTLSNNTNASAVPVATQQFILGVPGYTASGYDFAQWTASANSYAQISLQNTAANASASTDFVATADNGSDSTHYADFGINSSLGGSTAFTNANAAYLYSTDNELDIGALGASGVVNFYTTGGTATPVKAGFFDATQNFNLTNPLAISQGGIGAATAAANTVFGNNTGSSAAPAFQTSIAISGTISSAAHTITSASANALTVGLNGATNPALQVDASTASSATGWAVKSAAAGAGAALTVISSGVSESGTIGVKGSGSLTLFCGANGNFNLQNGSGNTRISIQSSVIVFSATNSGTAASTARFGFSGGTESGLTASTETPNVYFNMGQTRQHATGALPLQRDIRFTGTTHSFVGASTITDCATFAIDGYGQAGTNATITNAHGILIQTQAVAGTVGTASAVTLNAPTGATNNYALNIASGSIVIKSGSNARIGVGTLSGGTLAVANTSVTANTLVFLTDTSGSTTNVGSLTVTTSVGVGFTVTSTIAIDTSTFNWLLIEKN